MKVHIAVVINDMVYWALRMCQEKGGRLYMLSTHPPITDKETGSQGGKDLS